MFHLLPIYYLHFKNRKIRALKCMIFKSVLVFYWSSTKLVCEKVVVVVFHFPAIWLVTVISAPSQLQAKKWKSTSSLISTILPFLGKALYLANSFFPHFVLEFLSFQVRKSSQFPPMIFIQLFTIHLWPLMTSHPPWYDLRSRLEIQPDVLLVTWLYHMIAEPRFGVTLRLAFEQYALRLER